MQDQTTSKNQNPYRVHFSGLKQDERQVLKQIVEALGGAVDENLTFFTKYLICTSVDNLKHRVALNL